MTDYIERDAVLAVFGDIHPLDHNANAYFKQIKKIPAADVRPVVRGRWMSKEYMYGYTGAGTIDEWVERPAERSDYYAYCSACGQDAGYDGEQSLVLSACCPHCGAWMVTDCHQLEEEVE